MLTKAKAKTYLFSRVEVENPKKIAGHRLFQLLEEWVQNRYARMPMMEKLKTKIILLFEAYHSLMA